MEWFGLLLGHLVGDYVVQNDWMAANKVNRVPGRVDRGFDRMTPGTIAHEASRSIYDERRAMARKGHLACTVHCLCYTAAVVAFSFWWMPWWAYVLCFLVHWPIDRFRLARWWMERVGGQKAFVSGPLSPWSVIVVDNIAHLLMLFALGAAATYLKG
jgi:hypothetical protein